MKPLSNTLPWPFIAIFTFFAFQASAQVIVTEAPPIAEPPAGPITTIEFEEPDYNFGVIEEGTLVTNVFTFTNTGYEPLILSNAKGSCGCTVPAWPKHPIAPGETASITVEFNSNGKRGKRNQRVTITANTDPAFTFLSLQGEINPKEDSDEIVIRDFAAEAEDKPSPDCFAIYPNPTGDILKLEMSEESMGQPALITINSMTGQKMAQREIPTVEGTIEFSVEHYPAGTYIAMVQVGNQQPEARCFVVVD